MWCDASHLPRVSEPARRRRSWRRKRPQGTKPFRNHGKDFETTSGHGIRDIWGKCAGCHQCPPGRLWHPPKWSPAPMPDPLPYYQFSTSSQSELLKCNLVLTFKFIKFLSPGHVMSLLKPSDGFLLHLEQNPEFLCKPHDPVRSLFLFLEQIHPAATTGPLHWLFALGRPLSRKPPELPRAGSFSSFSSIVTSSLKSPFIIL